MTLLAHVSATQSAVVVAAAGGAALAAPWLSTPSSRPEVAARTARRNRAWVAAMAVIVLCEVPPLGTWVDERFSAHMVQHLVLCFVAAPLIVLARPGRFWTRVASPDLTRSAPLRRLRRARLGRAPVGLALFTSYVWLVHFTPIYDVALDVPVAHLVEHVAFVGTAVLLWAPVLGRTSGALSGVGSALYIMVLMPVVAFCGLAIFSADQVLYRTYAVQPDALSDQRIGGAIMWVLPIVVLLPMLLALTVRAWRNEERVDSMRVAASASSTPFAPAGARSPSPTPSPSPTAASIPTSVLTVDGRSRSVADAES